MLACNASNNILLLVHHIKTEGKLVVPFKQVWLFMMIFSCIINLSACCWCTWYFVFHIYNLHLSVFISQCTHTHAHTCTRTYTHVFPTDPVLFICTCTNLPFMNTACFNVARCLHVFPIAWYLSACAPLKNILQTANLSLLISPPHLRPWERTTPPTGHLSLSVVV